MEDVVLKRDLQKRHSAALGSNSATDYYSNSQRLLGLDCHERTLRHLESQYRSLDI
jgi:hypothetical protein